MRTMSYLSKLLVVAMVAMTSAVSAADFEKKETAKPANVETKKVVVNAQVAASSFGSNDLAIYFVSDVLTVSFINKKQETAVFTVSNLDGETIYRKTSRNNPLVHYRIATQKLPEGTYFATLKVGKEKYSREINIER